MTHDELCRMEQSKLIKLIDEGKLIYLPCKVGDTVYFIKLCFNYAKAPIKATVTMVKTFSSNGAILFRAITENGERTFIDGNIGKTVFLTFEEAEKALKEREKNGMQ